MASLTPLSKGLIGLAVVGAMVSAVWNFALKERLGEKASPPPVLSQPAAPTTPAAQSTPPAPSTPAAPSLPAARPAPQALPQAAVKPAEQPAPPGGAASPQPGQAPASRLSPAEHAEAGRRLLANKDFEQARLHLEQAVQGGDGASACLLGEMTLQGQGGIAQNQDEAARLFQLAQSRNTICFASGR